MLNTRNNSYKMLHSLDTFGLDYTIKKLYRFKQKYLPQTKHNSKKLKKGRITMIKSHPVIAVKWHIKTVSKEQKRGCQSSESYLCLQCVPLLCTWTFCEDVVIATLMYSQLTFHTHIALFICHAPVQEMRKMQRIVK